MTTDTDTAYAALVVSRRRLLLLRILSSSAGTAYTADETVLRSALQTRGHACSRDDLAADLRHLEARDLVLVQSPGGVRLVTLLPDGDDVARGLATADGVATPRPGEGG